jgi:hypothetical protein
MKTLLIISLIISGIVIVNEWNWIGKSSLAWPILGLATSIILIAIYLLGQNGQK